MDKVKITLWLCYKCKIRGNKIWFIYVSTMMNYNFTSNRYICLFLQWSPLGQSATSGACIKLTFLGLFKNVLSTTQIIKSWMRNYRIIMNSQIKCIWKENTTCLRETEKLCKTDWACVIFLRTSRLMLGQHFKIGHYCDHQYPF